WPALEVHKQTNDPIDKKNTFSRAFAAVWRIVECKSTRSDLPYPSSCFGVLCLFLCKKKQLTEALLSLWPARAADVQQGIELHVEKTAAGKGRASCSVTHAAGFTRSAKPLI
ncbi:uncharacterized, partial [Tachysurus ichikawai]